MRLLGLIFLGLLGLTGFCFSQSPPAETELTITPGNGFDIMSWDSVIGEQYLIEYSVDLAEWDYLPQVFVGNGSPMNYWVQSTSDKIFFRITGTTQDLFSQDSDNDGYSDAVEVQYGTDRHNFTPGPANPGGPNAPVYPDYPLPLVLADPALFYLNVDTIGTDPNNPTPPRRTQYALNKDFKIIAVNGSLNSLFGTSHDWPVDIPVGKVEVDVQLIATLIDSDFSRDLNLLYRDKQSVNAPPLYYKEDFDAVRLTIPSNQPKSNVVEYSEIIDTIAERSLQLIDIGADTDRNGLVEFGLDSANEENWTKDRGAIYTVNFDRDGDNTSGSANRPDAIHFEDDASASNEDWEIENAPDEEDIAHLKISKLGSLPEDFRFYLVVEDLEDMRSIHLFNKIEAGAEAIWGSYGDPYAAPWISLDSSPDDAEIEITDWINTGSTDYEETRGSTLTDYLFGIEGLAFRGMEVPGGSLDTETGIPHHTGRFSGEIQITLVGRFGFEEFEFDKVRLRVAPWIAQSHNLPLVEAFIEDNTQNEDIRLSIPDANESLLSYGSETPDQWIQDHIEFGYTQRPGGPMTQIAFRLPRARDVEEDGIKDPLASWPLTRFLSENKGVFQIGVKYRDTYDFVSTQYGGNLEVLAPNTEFPLGRVLVGGKKIDDDYQTFLEVQQIQKFFPEDGNETSGIEVDWLNVGHIDEVMGILGTNSVAIADTALAINLLKTIPDSPVNGVDLRASTLLFTAGATRLGVLPAGGSGLGTSIPTGFDHTNEQHLKYIRFYEGAMKGIVCKILSHNNGSLDIERIWHTGKTGILNGDTDPNNNNQDSWDYFRWKKYWTGKWDYENDQPHPSNPPVPPPIISWVGGSKYVLFEDTLYWPSAGNPDTYLDENNNLVNYYNEDGMPAAVTVRELLSDTTFVYSHENPSGFFRRALESCKTSIQALNVESVSFSKLPALFLGRKLSNTGDIILYQNEFLKEHTSEAFVPGSVNFQINGGGQEGMIIPKQYSAKNNAGEDIFEKSIANTLNNHAPINFRDCWYLYHVNVGEIHCGTSYRRGDPVNMNWWENIPQNN